ncbi:MAG: excinuclease ABC subunit UvrC [Candidatus Eremiobacteraeota bacterium]|nr:excinuclease ABC subunit UvrC [Candidatus Eremiobacteraeota bacterium]MBV8498861.1 excinuclease ABC subunit UvrC [Candidatus Eremiobacteraeota bacterium]
MVGRDGEILYIGKAISLRNRVRSYFQEGAVHHVRTTAMVEKVADVRTIVVTNEVEALILEANLIKRHQPPFNVRLRDDKRYPYLKVTNEPFPRVVFTRMVRNDGARYFGPYTNAHGLRELIDLVRLVFPLRTCREPIDGRRKRPCLQYHIKRCLAPCVGYQTEEDYDRTIDEVVLFLEGKQESLLTRLQREMAESAGHLNFEAAARIRDRIVAVRRVTEEQKVVWKSRLDMDLIAVARAQGQACMQVFLVRGGKLIGQEHFILEGAYEQPDGLLTGEFLKQFYTARTAGAPEDRIVSLARVARDNQAPVPEKRRSRAQAAAVPKELLVSALPEERATIEAWLSEVKGQRVRILQPRRGARAEYLRLVQKNAEQNLKAFLAHQEVQETAQARALTDLADALELPEPPHRIECYDVSNIQGTNPTASMVVFVEGRARKSEYRKFKIQYDGGPNDFAMMQETLRRRLRYLRRETDRTETPIERELAKKEKFNKKPDLLLIDGGKGQLSAVVEVLEELDMTGLAVAGLAKEHEWLYLPNQADPIVLPANSPALHLVARIRDEAHRFAVTYHRQRRAKSMTRSALDALAGVGPVRRKRLLSAFGSPAGIRRAGLDEIAAVKGMTPTLAAKIKQELEGGYRS